MTAVHFEPDVQDTAVLRRVIEWKSQQYRRAGLVDLFRFRWANELLERLLHVDEDGLTGTLSVLYVGEEVAAAHMGMRSRTVWHWWFPAYSARYGSFSPGGILLLNMLEHAGGLGVQVIDLGKGDDPYKRSFMTGSIPIMEGMVFAGPMMRAVRTARRCAVSGLRRTPIAGLARSPARMIRRVARWHALR
jgi:CelD/BcsL family acetyltransferase involved in cellulose biosynthesis